MHTSLPGSNLDSPRTMVPPSNPFAIPPASARTPGLPATSQLQVASRSSGYSTNTYNHSESPSTASGSLSELQNQDSPGLIISPTQISSANLNAQKRAYRQRRKDPSCDACRERKVKCDATETSACSECSSRNHKCQFTKETNRRMSSIKQVQDLQTQIAELTQMNSQLRTKVSDKDSLGTDRGDMKRRFSEGYSAIAPEPRRVSVPVLHSFENVRHNVRRYGRDIFRVPRSVQSAPTESSSGLPQLPQRAEFAQLSRYYLDSIHASYPAVHWPTFQHQVDEVYTLRTFEGTSREWISLLFAVLACGSLQNVANPGSPRSSAPRGQEFFNTAVQALSPWPDEFVITHAQAALLLSIFAAESNKKSVGSMWLASAARVAQDLQISPEVDCWSVIDGEVRRRVWWSIYIRDRITSLETGRSSLIHETDCDISLPASVEDRYIQPQGILRPQLDTATYTGFIAAIHTTRLYADLLQALKSSVIVGPVLQSFDEQFRMKLSLLPEAYQLGSNAALEAAALPTLVTLLAARFHLYRHNLTPACRPTERSDAVSRCVMIAQDTAKYISRAVHNPPQVESEKSWQARILPIANNMVCMHMWRCVLILCFRGEYEAALMCLHFMSAVGSVRSVNAACGRHVMFFLDRLRDRLQSNTLALEHDEEMMAYVSGDVQGNLEQSWVWAGTDLGASTYSTSSPRGSARPRPMDEPMRDALPLHRTSNSPSNSSAPWDDWGGIEHAIRKLMEESRPRTAPLPTYYPPPHNPMKRVQLTPETRSPPKPAPTPSTAPSSSSRISIANII